MNPYNGFTPSQRVKALKWINGEYAAGRRTRPTECEACGQTDGKLQAHSEDYSEPYGDHIGKYGLCYTCHMMIHCRFSAPVAWDNYRWAIRSGYRTAPNNGNFHAIRRMLSESAPAVGGTRTTATPSWALFPGNASMRLDEILCHLAGRKA